MTNRSIVAKIIAGFLIVLLNSAALYYTYTRASTGQALELQRIITFTCCAQWLLYVVFVESLLVILIYHLIPRMTLHETHRAIQVLKQCAHRVFSEDKEMDQRYFLNAPDFLFLSNRLSRGNIHLFESDIVFNYRTFLPGMYGRLWEKRGVSNCSNGRTHPLSYLSHALSLTKAISYVLKCIGCLPELWQRFFIQLLFLVFGFCVLAVLHLCSLHPWVVLAVIGLVIVELRVIRCHLEGSEEYTPLDEQIMFDFNALLNYYPPRPPMKFTVSESKQKRKVVHMPSSTSPVSRERMPMHDDYPEEQQQQQPEMEGPEVHVPQSTMVVQERSGTEAVESPQTTPKRPTNHTHDWKYDELAISPSVRIYSALTGSAQKGSEQMYKGRDNWTRHEVAKIARSAEKMDRLYDKFTRKFRVISSTVHNLESTLSSVNSHVNGLGSSPSGKYSPVKHERTHSPGVSTRGGGYDTDDGEDEGGLEGLAGEGSESGVVEEEEEEGDDVAGEGGTGCLVAGGEHGSPKHRIQDGIVSDTECDVLQQEGSNDDRGSASIASPPKVHVLDTSRSEGNHFDLPYDHFNLMTDTPEQMMTCGDPVIKVAPKMLPLSVRASNAAKRQWRQQKKSLQIRRNLVLGNDGLEGVSIPDVDIYQAAEEVKPKRRRGRNKDTDKETSSPEKPDGALSPLTPDHQSVPVALLPPIITNTKTSKKKKEKKEKRKGQRVGKKVVPES
jgi:hypothetical protein